MNAAAPGYVDAAMQHENPANVAPAPVRQPSEERGEFLRWYQQIQERRIQANGGLDEEGDRVRPRRPYGDDGK